MLKPIPSDETDDIKLCSILGSHHYDACDQERYGLLLF